MPLPRTRVGLEQIGWKYLGESQCRACGVPILWFESTKLNPVTQKYGRVCFHIEKGSEDADHRILVPHWSDCPNAKDFRKTKEKKQHKS